MVKYSEPFTDILVLHLFHTQQLNQMNFPGYTIWIFALVLVLLALLALYPTPAMIGIAVLLSSALIVFQTILILRDQSVES